MYSKMGKDVPLAKGAPPSFTSKPSPQEAAHIMQIEGLPVVSLSMCKSQLLCCSQRPDIVL
jgi:hypothetical protein